MADDGTGTVKLAPQSPSVTVWLLPLATVVSLMGNAGDRRSTAIMEMRGRA
jgi:hypothetical protein